MEPILLQTSEADAGTRLDACLARAIEDLTRSAAANALWSSPTMLATSLMGPENFREY